MNESSTVSENLPSADPIDPLLLHASHAYLPASLTFTRNEQPHLVSSHPVAVRSPIRSAGGPE